MSPNTAAAIAPLLANPPMLAFTMIAIFSIFVELFSPLSLSRTNPILQQRLTKTQNKLSQIKYDAVLPCVAGIIANHTPFASWEFVLAMQLIFVVGIALCVRSLMIVIQNLISVARG